MPEPIDWDELRIGYNRDYGTKYATVRSFIEFATRKHNIDVLSDKLGVGKCSVDRIRKKLRLTKQLVPGFKTKKAIFLNFVNNNDCSRLTAKDISEKLNMKRHYIYTLCRADGIILKDGHPNY